MKQARIFFYSDPHFGHKNVIRYCNRPFSSVEEQTEELIRKYNSVITRDSDICIWVGDCFFCKNGEAKSIMNRLNGRKLLVRGNHDKWGMQTYMNIGFEFVMDEMWMSIGGQNVQIKHYPKKPILFQLFKVKFLKKTIKYLDRMPKNIGQWLIHGHTHNKKRFRDKQIHVGVDAWSYKPVFIEEIRKYIEG